MANRQSERRPADGHLRAEGNREEVAESEKSPKVWRVTGRGSGAHTMWTLARFQRPMSIPERNSERERRQDGKPDCTSRAVEDLQSWRG